MALLWGRQSITNWRLIFRLFGSIYPICNVTFLPLYFCRSVVKQLRSKQSVASETFDCATIMFSDLPVFSKVTSKCGPLKIIQFLNTVYSVFDEVIHGFAVYKVETVNDSYIVSSHTMRLVRSIYHCYKFYQVFP